MNKKWSLYNISLARGVLMGISAYLVENSSHPLKKDALRYYYVSLILNASWTFFFFKLKWFFFSSILVLIILYFVIETIRRYFKINKTAAYLQIPYVLWLLFAGFLSFSVWTLNHYKIQFLPQD